MWTGLEDKISSMVFRMEDAEAFQHSVWSIGATIKEQAKGALQAGPRTFAPAGRRHRRRRQRQEDRAHPQSPAEGRQQRPVSVRQRQEVQELPHAAGGVRRERKAMANSIKYEIILYWSQDDQAFIADVPELPGCAANRATCQDAAVNLEVVIQEWIDTARELGRPIPAPGIRLMSPKVLLPGQWRQEDSTDRGLPRQEAINRRISSSPTRHGATENRVGEHD